jgi:hypothetical protein
MKKVSLLISVVVLAIASICAILYFKPFQHSVETSTQPKSVKWGKITLDSKMIGKVVILKDTPINEQNENGDLIKSGVAKKGQEYGVYSLRDLGYETAFNKYISSSTNTKYMNVPKKLIEPLRKTQPFIVSSILNTKKEELYSNKPEDFIIGLHNTNKKIWLGYKSPSYGEELFFDGKVTKKEKNKLNFTFVYTGDQSKTGTGIFTLADKKIILKFKNLEGKTENITFPVQ